MATLERMIHAGGLGDYTTLVAWEAGAPSLGTDIWKGVIVDASAYDDESMDIANVGSGSATSFYHLTVAPGFRHKGVAGTDHARVTEPAGSNGHAIQTGAAFTFIEWLEIVQSSTSESDEGIRILGSATSTLVSKCIIRATAKVNQQDGIHFTDQETLDVKVDNCIIYGFDRGGIMLQQFGAGTNDHGIEIDYCTIADCDTAAVFVEQDGASSTATVDIFNTIGTTEGDGSGGNSPFSDGDSSDPTTTPDGSVTWAGSDNLVAEPADLDQIQGTNNLTATELATDGVAVVTKSSGAWVVFVSITGNRDYRLLDAAAGNIAAGRGTDRRGSEPDSRQDFSIDITGGVRTTGTDIGAHEFGSEVPFGAIVQAEVANLGQSPAVTIGVTLRATPVEDNLLVAVMAGRGENEVWDTLSGWTLVVDELAGGHANSFQAKLAGASESTGITFTRANSHSNEQALCVLEIQGPFEEATPDVTAEADSSSSSVTSQTTGTTGTTAQADEVAVAGWHWINTPDGTRGPPTAGLVIQAVSVETSDASVQNSYIAAETLTATGTVESTFAVETAQRASGHIATFKKESAGTLFDETGLTFTITATLTAATEDLALAESVGFTITATLTAATELLGLHESVGLTVDATLTAATELLGLAESVGFTINATLTESDLIVLSETGLGITVTATLSETDGLSAVDLVALTVNATLAGTDSAAFSDSVGLTIVSSLTSSDLEAEGESVGLTINATLAVLTEALTLSETGLGLTVNATLTAAVGLSFVDSLGLTVNATLAGTDALTRGETGLGITVAATLTSSDSVGYVDSAGLTIDATLTTTDVEAEFEVGLGFTIDATLIGTDARGALPETGLELAISSTLSSTDVLNAVDVLGFTIDATLTATDVEAEVESLGFTVAATLSSTDTTTGNETGRAFTIVSTITSSDLEAEGESVGLTVNATLTSSTTAAFVDSVGFTIVSSLTSADLVGEADVFPVIRASTMTGSLVAATSDRGDLVHTTEDGSLI